MTQDFNKGVDYGDCLRVIFKGGYVVPYKAAGTRENPISPAPGFFLQLVLLKSVEPVRLER